MVIFFKLYVAGFYGVKFECSDLSLQIAAVKHVEDDFVSTLDSDWIPTPTVIKDMEKEENDVTIEFIPHSSGSALNEEKSTHLSKRNLSKSPSTSSEDATPKWIPPKSFYQAVSSGPVSCVDCSTSFENVSVLSRHRRLVHPNKRPFQCGTCNKLFKHSHHLMEHDRLHTGEKPFKCKFCPASFGQYVNVLSHTRSHTGEKPYACPQCNRRFLRRSSIAQHVKKFHANQKPQ